MKAWIQLAFESAKSQQDAALVVENDYERQERFERPLDDLEEFVEHHNLLVESMVPSRE